MTVTPKEASSATTQSAGRLLYKGTSNVRIISKADFKSVGIDHKTLRWDNSNLFMVPLGEIDLDQDAFDRVFKADIEAGEFSKTGTDVDRIPKDHPENNRFNQPDEPEYNQTSGTEE